MRTLAALLLALLPALLLALSVGCGSFASAVGEAKVYGGTRLDFATLFSDSATGVTRATAFVDIPFSLLMDTLFLPYTLGIAIGQSRGDSPRDHGHAD